MEITKINNLSNAGQPIDPKVLQALEDIDGLSADLQNLVSLVNNEKWHDFDSIRNLQLKIANESNALQSFMEANPSSFTTKEIDITKALVGEAGDLEYLPPQAQNDILQMAGVIQGIAQALHDLLIP